MKTKVLIIRFSSIGDIVLTTPVIRCLKKQLEGEVEIHYLTKNVFKSIVSENPYLTKVFGIDKSVDEVISGLKSENYDYIVDLHKNIRSRKVIRTLPGLSFSFDKLNWEKWLLVNFKINRLPKKHIVERYIESVKSLGVKNDNDGLDYFIPKQDEVNIKKVLPQSHINGYVGFVIGGTYSTKRLPTNRIIEWCKKSDLPVVLLGGKEDVITGDSIVMACGDNVFNTCGNFSINQSASLVQQSSTIYTHDTGLMHIAAAYRKDIVSIWGNTVPEFGMYPYKPGKNSKIVQAENLSCRPCSKLGYSKCPKRHFKCMQEVEI